MHVARPIVLAAVSIVGATLAATSARAELRVTYPGGGKTIVSDAQLRDEFDLRANPMRWRQDGLAAPPILANRPGMSAAEVVRLAGVDPSTLSAAAAMVISAPLQPDEQDGVPTQTLSKAEVLDGFADVMAGGRPPAGGQAVFWSNTVPGPDERQVEFTRPVRLPSEGITRFTFARGADVALALAGRVLPVSISAPSSARARHDVQFTASVGALTGLTYSWDFGDGDTSTATAAVHRFATTGKYNVRVTIHDGGGGAGVATKAITIDDGAAGGGDDDTQTPGSPAPAADAPSGGGTAPRDASVLGATSTPRNVPRNVAGTRKRTTHTPAAQPSATGSARGRRSSGSGAGGDSASGTTGSVSANLTQSGKATTAARASARAAHAARERGAGSLPGRGSVAGFVLAGSGTVIAARRSDADRTILTPREQAAARAGTGGSPRWPAWTAGALMLIVLAATGVALETIPNRGPRLIYP